MGKFVSIKDAVMQIQSSNFLTDNNKQWACEAICKAPTADVREIKRGYWKTREKHNDFLWVECSCCGFRVENYRAVNTGISSTDIKSYKWKGCPVCLAVMDIEVAPK